MATHRFLINRVKRYFELRGYVVEEGVKVGGVVLDLVAFRRDGSRVGIEVERGLGGVAHGFWQLATARAYGFGETILVIPARILEKVDLRPFEAYGMGILTVSGYGTINYALKPKPQA
jgi:hypothetical protein